MTIYFNNSSLQDLPCGQRYYLKVIRGARVPKEAYHDRGLIFHKLAELVTPDDSAMSMGMINKPDCLKSMEDNDAILLVNFILQARDAGHILPSAKREFYFELDETHLLEPDVIGDNKLLRVGTIDQVHYNEKDNFIDIDDHKTTTKTINPEFMQGYVLKSQPMFYITAIKDMAWKTPKEFTKTFGAAATEAAAQGRIRWRYLFHQLVQRKTLATSYTLYHDDELASFERVLNEKRNLVAFYHKNPTLCRTKDGIMSGHCYFCAFKSICALMNPEKEEQAIESWKLGFTPYNPKHKDE